MGDGRPCLSLENLGDGDFLDMCTHSFTLQTFNRTSWGYVLEQGQIKRPNAMKGQIYSRRSLQRKGRLESSLKEE